MKLGTLTVALGDLPFDQACKFLAERGVQMVEIGCGGFPGKAHCDAAELLADEGKREKFMETLDKYHLEISALSSHGNMVHPDPAVAESFEKDFDNAILLAEKLHVPVVNTFSGCPGGSKEDRTPNWVTCPWPDDFSQILEYQWNEVLIPYWKKKVEFAKAHGVSKIAFELHPGFCVYNTRTMLRIRREVGPEIGLGILGGERRAPSSISTPRIPRWTPGTLPSTACWIPPITGRSWRGPGSSAPWAMATARSTGGTSSPSCAWQAMTTPSASNTRTASCPAGRAWRRPSAS